MTKDHQVWMDLFDSEKTELFTADTEHPEPFDPLGFPEYARSFQDATGGGNDESVIGALTSIGGHPVAAVVFDFNFLGGSMGRKAGDIIDRAMSEAHRRRVPFLAVTATGGARMQEGMVALSQMPRLVAKSEALSEAGVPRISLLGHPTTGGVYASFASLADIIVAEAGATIGFAGPRVAEAISGKPLPAGSHTAEAALEAGLVDAVVSRDEARSFLQRILTVLSPADPEPAPQGYREIEPADADAWTEYQRTRSPERIGSRQLIDAIFTPFVELHGDRRGADDGAVIIGLGRLRGRPVVVAGFNREAPTAAGFRKVQRAARTAERLRRPLITFVDTPGADPGPSSEYSGLAGEIARTFRTLMTVKTQVLCVINGEGGSGGALALACGDRVAMLEHAVFSVISPEGAATILYRDAGRAPQVAAHLRPTSSDMLRLGLVDAVLPEDDAVDSIGGWLNWELAQPGWKPESRHSRFERAGHG